MYLSTAAAPADKRAIRLLPGFAGLSAYLLNSHALEEGFLNIKRAENKTGTARTLTAHRLL